MRAKICFLERPLLPLTLLCIGTLVTLMLRIQDKLDLVTLLKTHGCEMAYVELERNDILSVTSLADLKPSVRRRPPTQRGRVAATNRARHVRVE